MNFLYLISTRVSSISTGLWKCITYFDQAVCLLHFSHNMATISSNIKTSCLPHVFAIYLFLSLHLPKMFLQAWNYCIFFIAIYKKLKKNLAFIIPQKLWSETECKCTKMLQVTFQHYWMTMKCFYLKYIYIYYSRFFVKINDDLDNVRCLK